MQMKANKIKTLFILWLDCKVKGMGRRGWGGGVVTLHREKRVLQRGLISYFPHDSV